VEIIAEVGATVTLLLNVIRERGIDITPDEATVMMLGIYEDTGNLTFPSVTRLDFEAAGYLLGRGANLNVVANMITRELTAEQIFLLNDLIQSATRYNIHGIDIVIAQASVDHYIGDIAVLAHKIKDMENLDVLFVLVLMEDRVYLIGRSRIDEVNVAEIAGEFGGGGHPTASSATIKGMPLIEAHGRLVKTLEEVVRPRKLARDLMVYPVKSIDPGCTMEETGEILTRYNLAVIPVVLDNKVVGLISKQIVEKAIHHGLNNSLVREYMTTEFSVVSPDTSLSRVQELIIGQNQRLLPVLEKEQLVGAISLGSLVGVLQEEIMRSAKGVAALESQPLYARKKVLSKLIRERLPAPIQSLLAEFGKVGDELGYSLYAVGGFVRDLLMRVENLDVDIVVEGDGIRLAEAFERKVPCRIRTHRKFGTAIILFPDGSKIDIATARFEVYESPAALPTVEKSSIKMDLYRRDFTINALALQLNAKGFGELIDFFGGVKDLKEKIVRVLHNLSFVEDPTRVFRAIRFEQRLGFQIGKHTQNLMRNAIKMGFMDRLSGGRVLSELILILEEDSPIGALKRMRDFNLLRFLHPDIKFDEEGEALFERIHHVLCWFDFLFLEERYERWVIYFYALIDPLKEDGVKEVCERLSMNERERKKILDGKLQADQTLLQLFSWATTGHSPRRSEIYSALDSLSTESKLFMMAKTTQMTTRRHVSLYFTQLKDARPLLKGADLIRMGIKPGPSIRKNLANLLKAKLDQQVITREDEMDFVSRGLEVG